MDMHFCKGKLKGISFLGKASNCHEKGAHCKNSSEVCHMTIANYPQDEENSCCSNEMTLLQMDADLIPACSFDFNSFNLEFCAITPSTDMKALIFVDVDIFKYYRPPPLHYDRNVLFQSFLC